MLASLDAAGPRKCQCSRLPSPAPQGSPRLREMCCVSEVFGVASCTSFSLICLPRPASEASVEPPGSTLIKPQQRPREPGNPRFRVRPLPCPRCGSPDVDRLHLPLCPTERPEAGHTSPWVHAELCHVLSLHLDYGFPPRFVYMVAGIRCFPAIKPALHSEVMARSPLSAFLDSGSCCSAGDVVSDAGPMFPRCLCPV